MSQTQAPDDPPPKPSAYKPGTGKDRYCRFVEDHLDVTRTEVLDRILTAFEQHQKVIVQAANGVGKSFGASNGGLAGTFCNADTTTNVTSGSYGQLDDTIWKPIKSLHRKSALPGRTLDNTRELKTSMDEEWYLKCLSPQYPGDLEGRHNDRMLYIIEEADKPGITQEHIDSALSTLTDEEDRILVICNPPTDETNVVHELFNSDEWHSIQFSSWDSHDCKVDTGEVEADKIGGLADLSKIEHDWKEFNGEEWPGLEQVKAWSVPESEDFRTDLDSRWYRRRAGIMPPDDSESWRPFSVGDVEKAYKRDIGQTRITPAFCGIDVARSGGDLTVMVGLHDNEAKVEYEEKGDNHHSQRLDLQDELKSWPDPEVNVDAVGEGSGLADELDARVPNINRFGHGEKAVNEDYRKKWGEGLQLIGEWLRDGGSFSNSNLYEELKIAARVVEFSERTLRSRGKVIEATPKERIKDELDRSPDRLDALLMALHRQETNATGGDVPLAW